MTQIKRVFQSFCESTSLHGYSYLWIATTWFGKVAFALVILIFTCIGVLFLGLNIEKYSKATINTKIDSTTAPLKEAIFPTITVCNFNQLEASYLKHLGVQDDLWTKEAVLKKYMKGHVEDFTDDDIEDMKDVEEKLNGSYPYYYGRQWCRDLFIHTSFEGKQVAWSDFEFQNEYYFGPYYYGTDFGACCFLSPHVNILQTTSNYNQVDASAKHGETNGLSILFDIEQFNYGYIKGEGAGLKLSLHDHRDKPMMQFSSLYIRSGTDTQISVEPIVTTTTDDAIKGLSPEDRKCFVEGENNLTALSYDGGFRYEMNNCIVDEGLLKIYWNCRCYPLFSSYDPYMIFFGPCKGKNLYCANEVVKNMGFSSKSTNETEFKVQEALDNPDLIGNITKPKGKKCLPACHRQKNQVLISSIIFPPSESFFPQPYFCYVASHILQISCTSENRKYYLSKKHPKLCGVLSDHEVFFGNGTNCTNWPTAYFKEYDQENETLVREMFEYGKHNLALVHIFFQSPYITKMKTDLEMTLMDFVANTGGLIGLFLGFSFISLVEIIYWCCNCFNAKSRIQSSARIY